MGWPVGHPITLFPYYLTFKIARHIRDMYPTSVALPYQLSEAYLPLLLHLLYELEQAAISPLPSSPKGEVFRHRGVFLPPLGG